MKLPSWLTFLACLLFPWSLLAQESQLTPTTPIPPSSPLAAQVPPPTEPAAVVNPAAAITPGTPALAPATTPAVAPATTPAAAVPAAAPTTAATAPAGAAAAVAKSTDTVQKMLEKGGPVFWVLICLSAIMVALIMFIVFSVRQGAVVSDSFMKTADALIRKQDYLGLLGVCNRRGEAIAQITQKTLDFATKNPTATFEEVREVTESEGQRQASILSQRITYLSDIGKVAPMVGLLGTVFGIIKQFEQISQMKMLKAQLEFAGGVSEALLNTAAGLFIAIPSMLIYSIYRGRVSSLISELEAATTHIMALLAAQYKRVTAEAAAKRAAAASAPAPARTPRRAE